MSKEIIINIKSMVDSLHVHGGVTNEQALSLRHSIKSSILNALYDVLQESGPQKTITPLSDNRACNPNIIDLSELKESLVDLSDQLSKLCEKLKKLSATSSTDQPLTQEN